MRIGLSSGASLLERAEATTLGRVVISVVVMVTLLAVVVTNLPDSALRQSLSKKTQPYLNAIGLDQNWGVFAPDPRREVIGLRATINYRDGSTGTWTPPVRDDLVGEYSDYRWQKFMENVIGEGGPGLLTEGTATWVARERRDGRPTQVSLNRRFAALPPPGPDAGKPLTFAESQLISLPITAKMLKGKRP